MPWGPLALRGSSPRPSAEGISVTASVRLDEEPDSKSGGVPVRALQGSSPWLAADRVRLDDTELVRLEEGPDLKSGGARMCSFGVRVPAAPRERPNGGSPAGRGTRPERERAARPRGFESPFRRSTSEEWATCDNHNCGRLFGLRGSFNVDCREVNRGTVPSHVRLVQEERRESSKRQVHSWMITKNESGT